MLNMFFVLKNTLNIKNTHNINSININYAGSVEYAKGTK